MCVCGGGGGGCIVILVRSVICNIVNSQDGTQAGRRHGPLKRICNNRLFLLFQSLEYHGWHLSSWLGMCPLYDVFH